jgi:hypothetical protein
MTLPIIEQVPSPDVSLPRSLMLLCVNVVFEITKAFLANTALPRDSITLFSMAQQEMTKGPLSM